MNLRAVPQSDERLMKWDTAYKNDPGEVPGLVEWSGPAPRLAIEDADTAYSTIDPSHGYSIVVGSPFTFIEDHVEVKVQYRLTATSPHTLQVEFGYLGDDSLLAPYAANWPIFVLQANEAAVTGEWRTVQFPMDLTGVDLTEMHEQSALGRAVARCDVFRSTFPDSSARRLDVSLIQILVPGGLRPLQHRQRTDAYGVGGVQAARTRTTFQSGMGARYPV